MPCTAGSAFSFSGVAIAGPLTHAFKADSADLPPDDIYAAFAGWHAEHAEIRETLAEELSDAQRKRWATVRQRLLESGHDEPTLVKVGDFFGEQVFVASVRRGSVAGSFPRPSPG